MQRAGTRIRHGGAFGGPQRACPHCGRTFKRSEHLERHIRTRIDTNEKGCSGHPYPSSFFYTKEKPFICHCGAAFTRRDLLTRHQRIQLHQYSSEGLADVSSEQSQQIGGEADMAAAAAAASLSGMSMTPWDNQPRLPSNLYLHGQDPVEVEQHREAAMQPFQQPLLSHDFFDPSPGVIGVDHFREFAAFLDGVGLPAEWSPYFQKPEPEPENSLIDPELRESRATSVAAAGRSGRAGTPFNYWLPSAPGEDRLAEANCDTRIHDIKIEAPQPLRVTEDQRFRLATQLDSFRNVVDPDFRLPSRHTLTRYITSYFQGFHLHLPFIHQQTWRIVDTPLELVLAAATMGAQYCFEHRNSERLFQAAKAILLERLVHETGNGRLGPKTSAALNLHNNPSLVVSLSSASDRDRGPWEPIDSIRAMVILMGFATWEPREHFVAEAFSLSSLLVQVLRDVGLDEDAGTENVAEFTIPQVDWLAWVRRESIRRSKLIAFTFLHIHSVAYNVYPVLRSNEVRLRLPCSTGEWKAPTASQWQLARRDTCKEQLNFQDALSLLLKHSNGTATLDPIPTPLGNYVLLHGLLQRIHIVRDLSLPIIDQSASLPAEEVNKLERALRSWTSGWQQAPESSLDPNNDNGPIPFTSSSLLGLAYVRIYLNLGPYRQLETRDPSRIARALCRSPKVERSDGVISALLYAAHALSIPVRLGVDRVARSQAFFWSVRHSLSGFECAVLLSKWLNSLKDSVNVVPLTDSEDRILHWVRCIVEEAYAVVDFEEDELDVQSDPAGLSQKVLKIWAHFFKSNTQWPFINMIGLSLERYRDLLLRGTG
ncbi:uncharacterized protein BCR38DRAFT_502903 [Pseudomassariella vexata]|uniref:C2H2-type domain-containing protein n=1 Tax=Pseudomassariella vexata TaxID=1141098 RepID=A0A1Y2EEE2_9PEZI|nr:uncharacterized protein BCR38DRAFT_502903 [Pseudomassariella vexata]ORY69941.1 hypothetical protein BCR38DRAFT_502903 [Pseudomassariella vexata]